MIIMVRIILVVMFLPTMLWVGLGRVWTEVRTIPRYVWWDWCGEIDAIRFAWRHGRFDLDDTGSEE